MISITQMSASHIDEAAAIEAQCFSDPWSRAMLAAELENPSGLYLAAFDAAKLVGYAGMICVLDEGHIHNVAVSPEYRKMGIGRSLIRALIQRAKDNGLQCLLLEVRAGNEAAVSLYQSLGFQQRGLRPNYYKNPREDALLMIFEII